MHTPKITATFGDKRLGRKRLLKALSITSAILFCSVTLTGCFKTETEKAEAKCLSGDAVSCVNAAKAYASGKDSKGNSVEKISDKSKQLFLKSMHSWRWRDLLVNRLRICNSKYRSN